MPVVEVREMRMAMNKRPVPVCVAVGLARWVIRAVGMPVVFVMHMPVLML